MKQTMASDSLAQETRTRDINRVLHKLEWIEDSLSPPKKTLDMPNLIMYIYQRSLINQNN